MMGYEDEAVSCVHVHRCSQDAWARYEPFFGHDRVQFFLQFADERRLGRFAGQYVEAVPEMYGPAVGSAELQAVT